jgi:hypothetical protein
MKVNAVQQLHVLLEGLLPQHVASLPCRPALEKLLTVSTRCEATEGSAAAWLCQAFGVARGHDVPVAPYAALADGLRPEARYCLRVDPVHLQPLRDRVVFAGAVQGLTMEEAKALTDALNRHFSDDGLEFLAPRPDRWYLLLGAPTEMQTTSPAEATGLDAAAVFPRGAAAGRWRMWINEAQMVLHEHPVNVARERCGQMPVNTVWPWGGGTLGRPATAPYAQVWADDPLARGLALAAGLEVFSSAASPRAMPDRGNVLLVHDAAAGLGEGLLAWISSLLRSGAIAAAHLHLEGEGQVSSHVLRRADLWKFWRRPRPLETYWHGEHRRARIL